MAALSMHCGRMLFTRQSLSADQSVACVAFTPPPTYETLMGYFLRICEIIRAGVDFVCLDPCPAAFPWSCIPGTVVRGMFPMKFPLLNFRIANTENCATLMTPRKYNINKIPQLFMHTISLMLGLRAGPARGVGKGGLQSSCAYGSVATAFRRRLPSCEPAVLPVTCPQVTGKAQMYQKVCVQILGRRRS